MKIRYGGFASIANWRFHRNEVLSCVMSHEETRNKNDKRINQQKCLVVSCIVYKIILSLYNDNEQIFFKNM